MPEENSQAYGARAAFFRAVFGEATGFVCLAIADHNMKGFKEFFFEWPNQGSKFFSAIEQVAPSYNVWFCPHLFNEPKRNREHAKTAPNIWADLDECNPELLRVPPSITWQTSPGRWQAVWTLEYPVDPNEAEQIAKRIAYAHKEEGADTSGWDVTQLLRVPYTLNWKYDAQPTIKIGETKGTRYTLESFGEYAELVEGQEHLAIPFPTVFPDKTAEELLYQHRLQLNPTVTVLYSETPDEGKWSQALFNLEMQLFEGGLNREEVFIIASDAACNKFSRDGRDDKYLWQDVCRAFFRHERNITIARPSEKTELPLLSEQEREEVEAASPGWVEKYISWARGLGDAAHQYHQASAFIALSAVLSGTLRLPTSFGVVVPNLWFMILADTTLTRKTTSMDLGMSVIEEVSEDVLLATDGSIEGLFTSLSTRASKPGIFLRDEFTGLLEMMTKRDYMAGFAEALTKLYDGKTQKRILRKETVHVKDPIVIVYAGGIKSRMQLLLTHEQVASGFLPRFVFITAESDINRIKPMGPPTVKDLKARQEIVNELRDIYGHYNRPELTEINGKVLQSNRLAEFHATLSPDAWIRYNTLESVLMKLGMESIDPAIYTPLYDRLGKSILKAAVLIAAARQRTNEVVVEQEDIVRAAYYGEGWRTYAKEIVEDVGTSQDERRLEAVMRTIQNTGGCHRSVLMQHHHLSAREASWVLETLDQRMAITRVRAGRGEMIYPAGFEPGKGTKK